MPPRLAWGLLVACARAHVPTYGVGKDNCFTPPHKHTTSQVIYVKGSGGLEVEIESDTKPFDIPGGKLIDFDAVFKYEYDQTSYDLYIGCGSCVRSLDPPVEPPQVLAGYQPGHLEPFTQTTYRSVFPKANRTYDASLLVGCAEKSFTIRVVDYHNRTRSGHDTLIWGAVIGKGESFTALELLSFPLYVLRNHGDTWNGLGWTWWTILGSIVPTFWLLRYLVRHWFDWRWLSVFDRQMTLEPRAWLCELAILAFLAVMIEKAVHLAYAQSMAEWSGREFGIGLGAVAVGANGFPILVQFLVYFGLYHRKKGWRISRIMGSPWWWPLELASGVSWLFLFGAGFYLGPALVILDALFRAYEAHSEWGATRLDELMEGQGFDPQYKAKVTRRLLSAQTRVVPAGANAAASGGGGGGGGGGGVIPKLFI